MGLTQEVASFVAKTRRRDIPEEVLRSAKGFILDGFGVALAGSTDECSRIVQMHIRQMGARGECAVLGTGLRAPAPKAALANGVAAHAMDYDDTQLSTSKEAVYGLLTHPTTPVLAAVLAIGEKERISGEELLLAYLLGVEVECRIARGRRRAVVPRPLVFDLRFCEPASPMIGDAILRRSQCRACSA